jgi:hypothetical protein
MVSGFPTAGVQIGSDRRGSFRGQVAGWQRDWRQFVVDRRRGAVLSWGCSLAVLAVAVLVYWASVDEALFAPKPTVRSWIESVVATGESAGPLARWIVEFDRGVWEPLGRLSLISELRAHGAGREEFIPTNVALHAIAAWLLYLVMLKAAGSRLLAACAAGVFAAHPITVSAVASLAGRTELLAAVFGLLATLFYVDFWRNRQKRSIVASVLSATGAGLTSPALVGLPVLLPLIHTAIVRGPRTAGCVGRPPFNWRRLDWRFWSLAAATIVAAVALGGQLKHGFATPTSSHALSRRLSQLPACLTTQLGRAVVPHWTGLEMPQRSWATIQIAIAAGAVILGTSLGAVYMVRRFPMICIGWLWFIAAAIPAAGLAVLSGRDGMGSCAYVPLIGLIVAVVWLVSGVVNSRSVRAIALPVLALVNVAILGNMTLEDAQAYSERWSAHLADIPAANVDSASGLTYRESKSCSETSWLDALCSIDSALDGLKETVSVECRTGIALETLGNTQAAVLHYRRALEQDQNCLPAEYNLGLIELENKRRSEAERHFWRALEIAPTQARPYIAIARIYEERGATFEAIEYLRRALEVEPGLSDFDPGARAIYPAEPLNDVINRLGRTLVKSPNGSEAGVALAKTLSASSHANAARAN